MKKTILNILFIFLAVTIGLGAGAVGMVYIGLPHNEELEEETKVFVSTNNTTEVVLNENATTSSGDVAIHFLELGNKYTGDCTYIKVGENMDILIDCGSKSTSIAYVKKYLDEYVTDGTLEYVIVTHAHQDHYAGFATSTKIQSIFDLFECKTIITFTGTVTGKTTQTMYKNFERELEDEINAGATRYTALQCLNETDGATREIVLDEENQITMTVLEHEFVKTPNTSDENENSVCVMVNQGDKHFLFTGDLEAEGEASLVETEDLPKVSLFKAGHHGSKTSSGEALLAEIFDVNNPPIVCVCCCAGSSEYTTNAQNQFPTKDFIERIAQYTTLVYVTTLCEDYKNGKFTSFNGNITIISSGTNSIEVKCSNNTTLLKDSEWFEENRLEMCYNNLPDSWK